jgi:hypothetical protein
VTTSSVPPTSEVEQVAAQLPPAQRALATSFDVHGGEGYSEKLIDAIEMIGEEQAAGLGQHGPTQVTPAMRYLHSSRTIHQLVTDRNRAVGIYLAVASLLLTASGAIIHANPDGDLILPAREIQRCCLPLTFGTLTVLAVFIALLLIRTRVGLIYEVAKMNALLGLPLGRVSRLSPLSIHFILHAMISMAGGGAAALFSTFLLAALEPGLAHVALPAALVGLAVTLALLLLYVVTVAHVTSDHRLQKATAAAGGDSGDKVTR